MFNLVDLALEKVITGRLPGVRVDFTVPTRAWSTQAPKNSVNIYLYDVCEDLERRQAGSVRVGGWPLPLVLESDPPRYAQVSYLMSTWGGTPQDDHGLLGQLFAALTHVHSLDLGTADSDSTALFHVGLPWAGDRTHAELWNAVDNSLSPSLHATVSVPLPAFEPPTAVPVVWHDPVVVVRPGTERPEETRSPAGDALSLDMTVRTGDQQ
ncbi:Pvc16 family protein [Kitasatospora sp. NPDC127116]|uniref:Pvc16 family protein n=1 Tax=unclassified Kitasatospora TaxID=2633591 RepID=UPI0033860805